MSEINVDVTMVATTCGACGVLFALPQEFIEARRADHKVFYCPNGCARHYPAQSKLEKAETALAKLQSQMSMLREGKCPHCRRGYRNLFQHIINRHGERAL